MDTEVFLQQPLWREEFHITEASEFLFNWYEILNILNYRSSHSIRSSGLEGQIILLHLNIFTLSCGMKTERNIWQPRYSIFLSLLQLQGFLQSAISWRWIGQILQLPTESDSWAHMTQRQKHRCFFAQLQNNSKTRNCYPHFSLHVIYYLKSSLGQKISFSKLLKESFKEQDAF